jgi:hypothetical protein
VILPPPVPFTAQVQVALGDDATTHENDCVAPTATATLDGVTVMPDMTGSDASSAAPGSGAASSPDEDVVPPEEPPP